MLASQLGNEKVVHILVDAGVDFNAQGISQSDTALHEASRQGHEKIVQIILDAGADVNARRPFDSTALQVATAGDYMDIAQMLIKHGAQSE